MSGADDTKARFGTFAGVFTPTVLTILGVILFLRLGWVVGQTGLLGALLIIGAANLISFITGLSLSAIATNMYVRTGGAYYMISRTLGLEIGGAIGIPLYLSQAVSVAFYVIGFVEALTAVVPIVEPKFITTFIVLGFGFLAFVGADFALRIQFVVLAVLGLALVSLFSGGWGQWTTPHMWIPEPATASFWEVFAIFFPAVTGVAVGLSMSGDLKDPIRSIPQGTLASIAVTAAVYIGGAVWLATHASVDKLIGDRMIMQHVALWPSLILLGVWASTLSSALGSVMAAPRTLQALSFDNVTPRFFGSQLGSRTEPRVAVLITTGIAVSIVWMGNLDVVAPIITMFFLNTYGMINLTAGLEMLVKNPSFRPQFKVPWVVSLVGALGCYATMFLISAPATIVAVCISYGIFFILRRRSLRQSWGDIRTGAWIEFSRFSLMQLEHRRSHTKNWRPNLTVFTSIRDELEDLAEVGTWLCSGRGIVTFCNLVLGNVDELAGRGLRETSRQHLRKYLHEHGVVAFAESGIVEDLYEGIVTTVQMHGVAGIEPNTCLVGWGERLESRTSQLKLVRRLFLLDKSTLLFHQDKDKGFGAKKRIDVWWRGRDRNAELMILLSHVISMSPEWESAKIRVIKLVDKIKAREGAEQHLADLLKQVRVDAEPMILVKSYPQEPFTSVLAKVSEKSDLIFLGMSVPGETELNSQAEYITQLFAAAGTCIIVRSGETEDVLDTDPSVS